MMFRSILFHKIMLADKVRMSAYQKAIKETIKKDDIVCDIGTGSGILAFFSIIAGAKKVYAIEREEIINETKKLANANGLEDRIIFINDSVDKVELPEKVDVITSELMGSFGLEENIYKIQVEARKKILKPTGKLVPAWLELYLIPVEAESIWEKHIGLWSKKFYGLDFSVIKNDASSRRYVVCCSDKVKFLAKPSLISRLNFYEDKENPLVFERDFIINKQSLFHGWVGYFKAGLSKNIILSTSPKEPQTHWRQSFFPLSEIVKLKEKDRVHCKIKSIPEKNSTRSWQWDTSVYRNKREIVNFSQKKEELTQDRKDFEPIPYCYGK